MRVCFLIRFMLIIVLGFIVLLVRPPLACVVVLMPPLVPRLVDSFVCVVNIILRLCLCQSRDSLAHSPLLSVISSVCLCPLGGFCELNWWGATTQSPSHPSHPSHPTHTNTPPLACALHQLSLLFVCRFFSPT